MRPAHRKYLGRTAKNLNASLDAVGKIKHILTIPQDYFAWKSKYALKNLKAKAKSRGIK